MNRPIRLDAQAVRLAAWLHPDGWLELHIETNTIPSHYLRPNGTPRLRLSVDGEPAQPLTTQRPHQPAP